MKQCLFLYRYDNICIKKKKMLYRYDNKTSLRIFEATCPRWKPSHDYDTLKHFELTYEKLHVDAIQIMVSLFSTPGHLNAKAIQGCVIW